MCIRDSSYYDSSGRDSFTKPYSEATAKTIDEEVSNLIGNCYEEAKRVLIEHKSQLIELAESLLEKEVIFKEDLVHIFGERPGKETSKDESSKVEHTKG